MVYQYIYIYMYIHTSYHLPQSTMSLLPEGPLQSTCQDLGRPRRMPMPPWGCRCTPGDGLIMVKAQKPHFH